MHTDYLQFIFQAINTLLQQNLGFFDAMGQNLFRVLRHHPGGLVRHQDGALRSRRAATFSTSSILQVCF